MNERKELTLEATMTDLIIMMSEGNPSALHVILELNNVAPIVIKKND